MFRSVLRLRFAFPLRTTLTCPLCAHAVWRTANKTTGKPCLTLGLTGLALLLPRSVFLLLTRKRRVDRVPISEAEVLHLLTKRGHAFSGWLWKQGDFTGFQRRFFVLEVRLAPSAVASASPRCRFDCKYVARARTSSTTRPTRAKT